MNEMKPEDVMRACDRAQPSDERSALREYRRRIYEAVNYRGTNDHEDVTTILLEYKKAILREKDAEIERLREVIVKGDYSSYTARLAAETWHRNNSEFIRRLESEIDRLKAKCEALEEESDINRYNCRQYEEAADTARAEAITEFAERLKAEAVEVDVSMGYGNECWQKAVTEWEIDQIAKEMKGETDGKTDL